MRILVNALSATSIAGRHVVAGLLGELAGSAPPECRWLAVVPDAPLADALRGLTGVDVLVRPGGASTAHWLPRAVWEAARLRALAARWRADLVANYSGVLVPGLRAPQVVVASNPRPLVPVPFWDPEAPLKHRAQRRLYRSATAGAALTVFNSAHLRALHVANGMDPGAPSVVVPHGLPADVVAAARRPPRPRDPYAVVAASVWSPYKGALTLVDALAEVRRRHGVPATLTLAGPWPSARHRRAVERRAEAAGVRGALRVVGHLDRPRLLDALAEARAFALPSHTESFGIPAVEAQALGTPTVGSSTTAMPEVCGRGGVYAPPGAPGDLADLLAAVLPDGPLWDRLSAGARANAARYRWAPCAAPLVDRLWARARGGAAAAA